MRDSQQAQLEEDVVDLGTGKEYASTASTSSPEPHTEPPTSAGPSRRERLRARQKPRATDSSESTYRHSACSTNRFQSPPVMFGCFLAAALATACFGRWFRRRRLKHKRQDVQRLVTKCKLEPSLAVQQRLPPLPLLSTTFVATAMFQIEHLSAEHESQQSGAEGSSGFSSAQAIQEAIHAGATCIGRTNTPEIALGLIDSDDRRSNPAEQGGLLGITASSAALVVAQQGADFALTTDHLSGARTSAACCGLYAYRPTRGAVSREGVNLIAGNLDAIGWICRTPDLLPRLGDAFNLPGGKTSKTELAKLILAQDLFGLWGDELTPACTATLIGCQKWAGDEVAPVSLLVYLRDSVPAAQPLMEADSAEQLMSAFGTAAGLIQQSEYVRCQSEQAGPNTSLQEAGSGIGEVDVESLEAAKQVQAELHRAMHAALSTNNGYLIIPTMPGPPIQRSAPADDLEQFERRTFELSALATLSGVPQVTVPVRMPGHAVTSISILSLHKSDMRLLHLAAKLGPLIAEAAQDVAVAMAEEQAEYDDQQQASTTGEGQQGGNASKAEKYKTAANEAFKTGDFDGAITGYSQAIQADPANPVYFSNRAMAYLKVMRFAEAKDDCDSALKLELNVKTLLRRGTSWLGLQEIDSARKDFKHVLSLEPNNRQARQELKALKESEAMFDNQDSHASNGTTEGLL
ncbi:TPA: Amidase 1 [Trebouxia sp. C0006]